MPFINDMATREVNKEDRKEQILRQWRETKNFPRKKKKQRRKELQVDWSIVNWNPQFDFGDFNMFSF
jgi:hypothetical protein